MIPQPFFGFAAGATGRVTQHCNHICRLILFWKMLWKYRYRLHKWEGSNRTIPTVCAYSRNLSLGLRPVIISIHQKQYISTVEPWMGKKFIMSITDRNAVINQNACQSHVPGKSFSSDRTETAERFGPSLVNTSLNCFDIAWYRFQFMFYSGWYWTGKAIFCFSIEYIIGGRFHVHTQFYRLVDLNFCIWMPAYIS